MNDCRYLLESCIIPKLSAAISHMQINPAAQDTQPIMWLLAWHGNAPATRTLVKHCSHGCRCHPCSSDSARAGDFVLHKVSLLRLLPPPILFLLLLLLHHHHHYRRRRRRRRHYHSPLLRWLSVLVAWLRASPNYAEVGAWYSQWKALLPAVRNRASLLLNDGVVLTRGAGCAGERDDTAFYDESADAD
jgi:hypothetical protein